MIDVAIADDETLFREGLKQLIEGFEGVEVGLEAENGRVLLDKLKEGKLPDVLLLDLNMPELTGVETAKILQKDHPEIKIVVLSTYFTKAFILNLIEIGAASYLPKNCQPEELEHCLREVVDKGFFYNEKVMKVIRENMMKKSKPKMAFVPELTKREKEVLQLICDQYSSSEIAEKLFISPRTVDGHRNNLLEKLGCRNLAGLVAYAIHNQLVQIKPESFWKRD